MAMKVGPNIVGSLLPDDIAQARKLCQAANLNTLQTEVILARNFLLHSVRKKLTLQETGEHFHFSKQYAAELEQKAIELLKAHKEKE